MSISAMASDGDFVWQLLYTKPRAEAWVEVNLRKQGFRPLLPRVVARSGVAPLFPRYLFVGRSPGRPDSALRGTFGVAHVVTFGDAPALVPLDVIAELRSRMNAQGLVRLDDGGRAATLFARAQQERVRALMRFAQAGFRVKTA